MKSALYIGTIAHRRDIPKKHTFQYPFFMWFLKLDAIDTLPDLGRWFSPRRFALSRFHRPDYFGNPEEPLHMSIKRRMEQLTGEPVTGAVYGLMNLRALGLYFSPVNFYFGYDNDANFTHFLAEVSNIPWNERHQYGYYVGSGKTIKPHAKMFHVSPFNGLDQRYQWHVEDPGKDISIGIDVDDHRGHIFSARLELKRYPLTRQSVRKQLIRRPIMTASIVSAIYWQALKLYFKGVPYVPYKKEAL